MGGKTAKFFLQLLGTDKNANETTVSNQDTVAAIPNMPVAPLNAEQQFVFDQMENTDESMFITGGAGTGKSHLLRYFMRNSQKKGGAVVVAPTGIAAINIGGQTIHSFFQFPPDNIFIPAKTLKILEMSSNGHKEKLRAVKTLIIDEISMVRVDLLNAIDVVLRDVTGKDIPFGGKQVIMFGDPFQLSPITPNNLRPLLNKIYGSEFFFSAPAFKEMRCHILTINHRQKNDAGFIQILNDIRVGVKNIATLNTNCYIGPVLNQPCITLVPRNAEAQKKNADELRKIRRQAFTYHAKITEITGKFDPKEYPTDEKLILKVGALVVMLENRGSWVNGTMGIITKLEHDPDLIMVGIKDKEGNMNQFPVTEKIWDKKEYYYDHQTKTIEENTVATFTQYPIKLAWALTIHKAQGQTYEEIAVDMGAKGAFAAGQTYVALSRCRYMNTLHLLRHIKYKDIFTDPTIVAFMQGATATPVLPLPPLPNGSDAGDTIVPQALPPQTPVGGQCLNVSNREKPPETAAYDELQELREENKKLKDEIERLKRCVQEANNEKKGLEADLKGASNDNTVQRELF